MQDSEAVKKKQLRTAIIAVCGLVAFIVAGLYISDPEPAKSPAAAARSKAEEEALKNFATPGTQVRDEDKWMAQGSKEITSVKEGMTTQTQEMEILKQRLEQLEKKEQTGAASAPSDERRDVVKSMVVKDLPPPPPPTAPMPGSPIDPNATGMTNDPNRVQRPVEIQEIDLSAPQAVADPTKKEAVKSRRVESFLPSGSFAKVVLLGGFDAPTGGQAANAALPVVLRVKSFARLPNYYKTNLKECFITANAYGDLASERAFIRTSKMSCVMRNGNVLEVDVKGHVNGEDGSFGMRGKVVSKQGQILAKSFFSGLFAGMGNSIAQQSQTVTTTPVGAVTTIDPNKTVQAGLGQGASTALNKIAEFYLNQANTIFPIIEISAERVGEVYLMEGVDFGTALVNADNINEVGMN